MPTARRPASPRLAALAALAALSLVAAAAADAAERFSSLIDDLPLMAGLAEDRDASLVFDNPGGRIATLVAHGALAREAVEDYYAAALPPLGWTEVAPRRWRRAGERLGLELVATGRSLTVRFTLSPD